MKKFLALIITVSLCLTLVACSKSADGGASGAAPAGSIENVTLTCWGAEEDQTMLRSMIDAFIEANKDKVNLTVNLGVTSESTAKDVILTDITAAADVFAFANDQITDLKAAGALQEIVSNSDAIKAANNASAVEAATVDGKLYAYPMTADNGYFMFYDGSFFTADDVKSLDKMMEKAAAAGKKITMQFDSGWYNYSFFQGAGFTVGLNPDGKTNHCDWNGPGGTKVVQAMLDIAANPGFVSLHDAEFVTGIKDGSIVAGINGTWNAGAAQEAWGNNYSACKLPTYTLDGKQTQMSSFSGYKLIGVNAFCKNTGWAMMLGEWLTNYDNQVRRFSERNQGPSNIKAAASDAVKADPAQAAFAAQLQFAGLQIIGGNYWAPTEAFGTIITQGNPDKTDLQTILDNLVAGITAPVE